MLRSRVLRLFVASLFTVVSTALPMLAQGAAEGAWQDLVMQGLNAASENNTVKAEQLLLKALHEAEQR